VIEQAVPLRTRLIGDGARMTELREEIARTARSDAKVLITGESGAGKELVAEAVHAQSQRARGPFVPLNCAGVPESLLESELFGHVKGSFTGAYRDTRGKLELAHRGTIFLDEVGEMTLRMQGLLLRFLETGEIQTVGTDRAAGLVNVRVIAATNRNLRDGIAAGTFREDLLYRLDVIHLHVPPLRERREDIPQLVEHFLSRRRDVDGNNAPRLSPETIALLTEYSWPGNVRELENVIERLIVAARGPLITPADLPADVRGRLNVPVAPRKERRRTVADGLYQRLTERQESFWLAVYPLYMNREITKGDLREVVRRGLAEVHGNYRLVVRLFNMQETDYKRFLNFLRKHDCEIPFKQYR
jgi:transcriptional regulator with PAS, ATPase and Fis domain